MSAPHAVYRKPLEAPAARDENVAGSITPDAVEGFDQHAGYSFVAGAKLRLMSTWAWPWWLADSVSAPYSASFSTAFSSAYAGGVGAPDGVAWGRGFSSAFS